MHWVFSGVVLGMRRVRRVGRVCRVDGMRGMDGVLCLRPIGVGRRRRPFPGLGRRGALALRLAVILALAQHAGEARAGPRFASSGGAV